MLFEECLNNLFISFLLNILHSWGIVSIPRDKNGGIIVIVKSEREEVCYNCRIDSLFDRAL